MYGLEYIFKSVTDILPHKKAQHDGLLKMVVSKYGKITFQKYF